MSRLESPLPSCRTKSTAIGNWVLCSRASAGANEMLVSSEARTVLLVELPMLTNRERLHCREYSARTASSLVSTSRTSLSSVALPLMDSLRGKNGPLLSKKSSTCFGFRRNVLILGEPDLAATRASSPLFHRAHSFVHCGVDPARCSRSSTVSALCSWMKRSGQSAAKVKQSGSS